MEKENTFRDKREWVYNNIGEKTTTAKDVDKNEEF